MVGVVVKVGVDVARDLREDREAHGGRQTWEATRKAIWTGAIVVVLILVLIVWPLTLSR